MRYVAKANAGADAIGANDIAICNRKARWVLLQKLGRHMERLGSHFNGSDCGCIGRHNSSARRVRAEAVFNPISPPMHHPHPTIIPSERLGADLRDDSLEPLSYGGASRYYFDVSVCMNINA